MTVHVDNRTAEQALRNRTPVEPTPVREATVSLRPAADVNGCPTSILTVRHAHGFTERFRTFTNAAIESANSWIDAGYTLTNDDS